MMSIQTKIQSLAPSMSPVGRRIAAEILEHPAIVMDQTISQLAVTCETSEASVVRFCRSLGLSGYSQLRIQLASEIGRESAHLDETTRSMAAWQAGDITSSDSLADAVAKVAFAESVGLQETIANLDLFVLEKVVDSIDGARRVVLFGVGASALGAADLQQKLFRIGRVAFTFVDAHEALTAAALLRLGDVAIGFSHGGQTRETVHFLATARGQDATAVAVTNTADAPVALAADLTLFTKVRETVFRSGAMASRIAQLTIVDCIFVGVAQRDRDETIKALAATFDAVAPLRQRQGRDRSAT